jgi:DNA (cytosine-5)-methyltransferase 1
VKNTSIKGLSLFSNIGIAEAHFSDLGIEMRLANEVDEQRAKLYSWFYPDTEMIIGDIASEETRTTLVTKAKAYGVNFVIATPPCQGMSAAGSRSLLDPRNQLIFYAIDIVKRVKPLFVLIENVPQQLKTTINSDGRLILIPEYITTALADDYNINSQFLVKAMNFGVPQRRERSIILLTHKTMPFIWHTPRASSQVIDLQTAIGHLPSLDPLLREGSKVTQNVFPQFIQKKDIGASVSKWHKPPTHPWRHVQWMMHTPTGKSAIFNELYFPKKRDGTRIVAHHNHYRRLAWELPCRTITRFNAYISTLCTVHPGRLIKPAAGQQTTYSDPRALSIFELMLVMSIPITWEWPGFSSDNFIRSVIGEGIPPKLTRAFVEELQRNLNSVS